MSTAKTAFATYEEFKKVMYKSALEYLDRGWSIIPISLDTKRPVLKWKDFQIRQTTVEEVDTWFNAGVTTESGLIIRYFNLALVCGNQSGICVVDADNAAAIKYAEENNLSSPLYNDTPRGKHFFWQHPQDGQRFRNKTGGNPGRDWPNVDGLDFRGDGGYVLLPPSVKFRNGEAVAEYKACDTWNILDVEDAPVWVNTKPVLRDVTDENSFSFEDMDLGAVRVASPEDMLPVRDQIKMLVARIGRPLSEGDNTDTWMIKFCGQMVRNGCLGDDLRMMAQKLYDDFFSDSYSDEETTRWIDRKCQSAAEMDRNNYPSDYNSNGERIQATVDTSSLVTELPDDPVEQAPPSLKLLTISELRMRAKSQADIGYFIDPVLAPGQITQVVGFNGHGKSLLTLGMIYGLTTGSDFGPWAIPRPIRTLYMDFDGISANAIYDRTDMYNDIFGDPGDYLLYWSPSMLEEDEGRNMSLADDGGLRQAKELINYARPGCVVIDTVRSGFEGMQENSAEEWSRVNLFAKEIRDAGCAVILVHHRNKPGEGGLGREAGSTAQLKDLDTQLIVTSVHEDLDAANRHAGLLDGNLTVYTHGGVEKTPFGYIRSFINPDDTIITMAQVAFGKKRDQTDNKNDNYIAICRKPDGGLYIQSTLSPRLKARALIAGGTSLKNAASILHVPPVTIQKWENI